MSSSSSYTLATIVEKISNTDADLRIVATADLYKGLQSGSVRLDGDQERKICSVLLQRLEVDSSKPVQENVNLCIKHLVTRVSESNADELATKMVNSVIQGNDDRRSVFSLALKVLLGQIPAGQCAQRITKSLIGRLITGMEKGSLDVASECMELAKDLSLRFGPMFAKEHQAFMDVLHPHLMSTKPAMRRRAKECVGFLAPSLSNQLFNQLMEFLISNVESNSSSAAIEQQRTAIQAIGSVARQCGGRVGPFLDRMVPLLDSVLKSLQQIEDQEDPVFELMENIIQVFDTFVMRCPREADKHLATIQEVSLALLKYDPFREEDSDEDEESEEDEDSDEDDEEWDDEDFDEDTSYKVRRASAKCVKSIASTRSDRLTQLYNTVAEALISRFKEALEPVKLEVFNAFVALVKQTKLVVNVSASGESSSMEVDAGAGAEAGHDSAAIAALSALVPRVVRVLAKDLNNKKQKKVKSRSGCIQVVSEILDVLPSALSNDGIAQMVSGLLRCLVTPTTTTLKLEALKLLWTILKGHDNALLQPLLSDILKVVLGEDGALDKYFKVSAQSLRVLTIITTMLSQTNDPNAESYVQQIFESASQRFAAQDIDQEVKECAIETMCTLMAHFGQTCLKNELNSVLEVLLERLGNETTRTPAINGLGYLASHDIDLAQTVEAAVRLLVEFFKKNSSSVKQSSLIAIEVIIRSKNVAHLPESVLLELVQGLAPLVSEADLYQAHLALKVCIGLAEGQVSGITQVLMDHIMPSILVLLQSPLLQGMALQSTLTLLQQLVQKGIAFQALLMQVCGILKSAAASSLPKTALSSIAKAVGALCVHSGPSDSKATVEAFVADTQNDAVSDLHRMFALLAIGEVGRISALEEQGLDITIARCLESTGSEDIKHAAAYALGCICVGNAPMYFGTVLREIEETKDKKYLLLQSVKEWISQAIAEDKSELVAPYLQQLLDLLFALNEAAEEGVRNIAGECLGKLALVSPSTIIPLMLQQAQKGNTVLSASIVTALRFTVSDASTSADEVLGPLLQGFLELLDHAEISVRRPLLLTLNTIARNKPRFVRGAQVVNGASLLSIVYRETVPNPAHIRSVQIGPFKHQVDDGLELRMAAFECLDTLFDTCLDRVDPNELVHHLVGGLKDDIDVKMLCQLMLLKVVNLFQSAAAAQLDEICAALFKTLKTNAKGEAATPTEVKRHADMHKSAFRAIFALRVIDDTAKPILDLITDIEANEKIAPRWQAALSEAGASNSTSF
eukprot:TRINITY_DN3431_c0_g3_i2.p1 TRINITY_DN3431_c0_g3~~TRINITY_DN3431_c0_g3_i2.p1  ORF type:complete len:1255 (+),score=419.06 TRINITY_DN3431_c0_g3_i2:162-3926(+)